MAKDIKVPTQPDNTLKIDEKFERGGIPDKLLKNPSQNFAAILPLVYDPIKGTLSLSSSFSLVNLSVINLAATNLSMANVIASISASTPKLKINEGSNAYMGAATLSGGMITIVNTSVQSNSRIFITAQNDSANAGFLEVYSIIVGTSFTIKSSNALDDRNVAWLIITPA